MFLSHTCLSFFVVALACGSSAFLLNEHANASVSHPDNCNYNIYSKIDALERTLHNLETTVREKTAQMDTLESTVREKTTHSDTLMRQVLLTVTEMEAKIESSNLRNISLEIEEFKQNLKNITETSIGFTTKLDGMYSSSLSNIRGSPILFNKGNAYNGTVFTCPSPGIYLFHVSVITTSDNNGVWIYKNSHQLTLAYSGTSPQANGASVSAATWLDTGDHVYLRPYSSSLLILDGNSAFIGVKII
uniref:C1q domain-containing protein n=1 Tax=Magallana gigas TaxID=29159 RepID=A0A8W8MGE1_MAGGI|nr:uncharacterized protein LOC117683979 [Crassostrea gigas]